MVVRGTGPGGASDIASDEDDAVIRVVLEAFKPLGDIIGTVFVDRNRNGLFDKVLDTPVHRARVVLAGGVLP
ncbi:hypothetical protein ACFP81_07130 [Deinococcus lacus]|uniref:Uncharacterized protein n=1 Tax=Deinococcus lacus TaxID=392561 RepID=A0ABW1YC16_9DEIO